MNKQPATTTNSHVTIKFIVTMVIMTSSQSVMNSLSETNKLLKTFLCNVEKWPNILKNLEVCTPDTSLVKYVWLFIVIHLFFCKQFGSDLSPQSWLYFQGFCDLKLLNGCLVVWPSNHVWEQNNDFQDTKSIFMITDFKILLTMLLWQLNFVLSV